MQNSFLLLLSCLPSEKQGTGFSLYNVTPLPAAPPCLPLDIKDSLKEDMRLLLWGLLLVGFLMWEALEGKRIAKEGL
jgi:hypothetical protein